MRLKNRKGQAAIEYITVLTIMLIMMISLGLDLMTTTMGSTAGTERDLLLKQTSKELELAVWEVEHLKTFRTVPVQVPGYCEYQVYDNVVWSYCQLDPTNPSSVERRVLAASKKVKITSDPSPKIGDKTKEASSTGVIRIAPAS